MLVLLDKPFISKTLIQALRHTNVPVLENEFSTQALKSYDCNLTSHPSAIDDGVYSNSENALNWLQDNYPESQVNQMVALLKDKAAFRDRIKPLHQNFYFRETTLAELESWEELPTTKKVIIKPTVGFLSLGVIKVDSPKHWRSKKKKLINTLSKIADYYPKAVVNSAKFIIEEFLDGSEYAIDAYYDSTGTPVILNISEHLFASEEDVNDRVYFTTKSLIERHLKNFTQYLKKTGELLGLRNFPVHAEIRITTAHGIVPIEFNALRFGGWCTSADVGSYAYGFNLYEAYFRQHRPDWEAILARCNDDIYSFVMLDNSTDHDLADIAKFDVEALAASVEEALEFRKFDHQEHPIFGILIIRTSPHNKKELDRLLTADFEEYITLS